MEEKEEKIDLKLNQFVKWFSELDKTKKELAGDKGANLGELYKNNLPTPNGFVVTTESFKIFLEKSELNEKINTLLENINENNLEPTSEKIMKLITNAEFPEEIKEEIIESYETLGTDKLEIEKGSALDILNNASEPIFVAVRTSPTNQKKTKVREQDTYLNIKGVEELLFHVKKCFASMFRKETLKKEKDIENLNTAVVIQEMIQGEKSGIIYSTDNTQNIKIKAIWGLGEGILLDDVNPDLYTTSKELELIDKQINLKPSAITRDSSGKLIKVKLKEERAKHDVLAKYEYQRLGDLSLKIEDIFEKPQEIEFTIEGNDVYLLQSRDIEKISIDEPNTQQLTSPVTQNQKEENKEIEKIDKITKTKIKLILDSPHFANDARNTGIKKIGLAKVEKIIFESKKHPNYFLESNYVNEYENLIYEGLKAMSEEFETIYVRTSDLKSNKFQNLQNAPKSKEENPFMGLHGIKYSLKNPEILKSELLAIKKLNNLNKEVGILLPQITSIEEVKKVKEILKEINFENPKIGIIVETPAAVQLIKDFTEEINFVLIETDDLMQSLLVLDKNNENTKEFLDPLHPALIYQLEYIIRVCKRREIETNISGEITSNKEILENLIKKGIDSILVKPENANKIANKIHNIENNLLSGTDEEPRQYEIEKAKEDLGIKEEKTPPISENIKEDIEKIEEEKQEYLKEHPEEEITPIDEEGEFVTEKEIKEHKEEKFTEEPEVHNEESEGEIIEDKQKAVELIEEEKQKYLKEHEGEEFEEEPETHQDEIEEEELVTDEIMGDNRPVQEKDTLGIF